MMLSRLSHKGLLQLFRYAIVGFLVNIIGYFLYLLLTWLGIGPKIAASILYILGAWIGFIGHRRWTFPSYRDDGKTLFRFFLVHVGGYVLTLVLMLIFVDWLRFPHQWVEATIIILVAGFLFLTFKYFVFPKRKANLITQITN
jgi:putative flippase GtrA